MLGKPSLFVLAIFAGACGGQAFATADGDAGPSGSNARSVDPRRYSQACTTNADCALVPVIQDCSSCCNTDTPVNAAAVQPDLDAMMAACGGRRIECTMACAGRHAACIEQSCILCGEKPCKDGVLVHTSITEPGSYLFEGTLDGATSTCSASLPKGASGPSNIECSPGVELLREAVVPPAIRLGLLFRTTTARSVTFRATRDGQPIGTATFEPAYASEPGPNGPQCEPKACTVAHATFP